MEPKVWVESSDSGQTKSDIIPTVPTPPPYPTPTALAPEVVAHAASQYINAFETPKLIPMTEWQKVSEMMLNFPGFILDQPQYHFEALTDNVSTQWLHKRFGSYVINVMI